jgi:hypothetical protein
MIYLLYMLKKLMKEIDDLEREPEIPESLRRLYEERDMARWKAWKAKQEEENNPRKKAIEQAKKRAEEELTEFYKLPLEIQEKYTPYYEPRLLKYIYIINESVDKFTSVDDIIKAENIK